MVIDAPLSVREAGFSLHAATRAGPCDEQGRQALLKYILRPPLSSERLLPGPDGLVRIALKVPKGQPSQATDDATAPCAPSPCSATPPSVSGSRYRPWAELLKGTFAVDVETYPRCGGRMRLLAVISDLTQVARFLHHRREPTEPPLELRPESCAQARPRLLPVVTPPAIR